VCEAYFFTCFGIWLYILQHCIYHVNVCTIVCLCIHIIVCWLISLCFVYQEISLIVVWGVLWSPPAINTSYLHCTHTHTNTCAHARTHTYTHSVGGCIVLYDMCTNIIVSSPISVPPLFPCPMLNWSDKCWTNWLRIQFYSKIDSQGSKGPTFQMTPHGNIYFADHDFFNV
jgi:hypothetical protein